MSEGYTVIPAAVDEGSDDDDGDAENGQTLDSNGQNNHNQQPLESSTGEFHNSPQKLEQQPHTDTQFQPASLAESSDDDEDDSPPSNTRPGQGDSLTTCLSSVSSASWRVLFYLQCFLFVALVIFLVVPGGPHVLHITISTDPFPITTAVTDSASKSSGNSPAPPSVSESPSNPSMYANVAHQLMAKLQSFGQLLTMQGEDDEAGKESLLSSEAFDLCRQTANLAKPQATNVTHQNASVLPVGDNAECSVACDGQGVNSLSAHYKRELKRGEAALSGYRASYELLAHYPIIVEPKHDYFMVSIHPIRIHALMKRIREGAWEDCLSQEGQPGGATALLTGKVKLTITAIPFFLQQSTSSFQPTTPLRTRYHTFSHDVDPSLPSKPIRELYHPFTFIGQTATLSSHPSYHSDPSRHTFLLTGLSRESDYILTITAANETHTTCSTNLHSSQLQQEQQHKPGQQLSPPVGAVAWPSWPFAFSSACSLNDENFGYPTAVTYPNLQIATYPYTAEDRVVAVTNITDSTGPEAATTPGAARGRFAVEWPKFLEGMPSVWEESDACPMTFRARPDSTTSLFLRERAITIQFADLLYAADHPFPELLSTSSPSSSFYRVAPIPKRQSLSIERSSEPGNCPAAFWDWYFDYTDWHSANVAKFHSGDPWFLNADSDESYGPEQAATKIEEAGVQFCGFTTLNSGTADRMNGTHTHTHQGRRSTALRDQTVYNILRMCALTRRVLVEVRDENDLYNRGWYERWRIMLNSVEMDQRIASPHLLKQQKEPWMARRGGYEGKLYASWASNEFNSQTVLASLGLSEATLHGCLYHAFTQIKLSTLMDTFPTTVPSLSALLRPDYYRLGVHIRAGDAQMSAQPQVFARSSRHILQPYTGFFQCAQQVATTRLAQIRLSTLQQQQQRSSSSSFRALPVGSVMFVLTDAAHLLWHAAVRWADPKSETYSLAGEWLNAMRAEAGAPPIELDSRRNFQSNGTGLPLTLPACLSPQLLPHSAHLMDENRAPYLVSTLVRPAHLKADMYRSASLADVLSAIRSPFVDYFLLTLPDDHVISYDSGYSRHAAFDALNQKSVYVITLSDAKPNSNHQPGASEWDGRGAVSCLSDDPVLNEDELAAIGRSTGYVNAEFAHPEDGNNRASGRPIPLSQLAWQGSRL